MQFRIVMSTVCVALFCAAPVLAQAVPDKAEMQKRHAEMCSDRYAEQIGEMAYLEARLAPRDNQKRLFDHWKTVMLSRAKERAAECAAHAPPDKPPSIIDRMTMEEKMLRQRLADLQAEMPALEALFRSLNDEQKHVFRDSGPRPPMGPMGGHRPPGPPHDFAAGSGMPRPGSPFADDVPPSAH